MSTRTLPMRWGPLDGGTWTRPIDDGQCRVAFTSWFADAEFGAPVHVYESAVAGAEWVHLGEMGWDGVTTLYDLRRAMEEMTRRRSATEGDC